jgi:hypothetical protein
VNLPRRQQQLYDLLFGRGDVPISDLYAAITKPDCDNRRDMQQWLGSYITRMNRRLRSHGLKVEPGALKGTYRLVTR